MDAYLKGSVRSVDLCYSVQCLAVSGPRRQYKLPVETSVVCRCEVWNTDPYPVLLLSVLCGYEVWNTDQ